MKKSILAAAMALAVAAPLAHAHKEGSIIVRAGYTAVVPDDDSSSVKVNGAAVPGTEATVDDGAALGITIGYMLTDHIGLDLLLATPFNHDIKVKGVPGVGGKFADVDQLPPTLVLQYFPNDPSAKWQPYVGAGINYTAFFNEDLTSRQKATGFSSLSLDESWGLALQVGSDYMITDKLMLNAAVWYLDIDTEATTRLGAARVKVDVDVDPWVFMVGLGYRF